MFGFSSFQIFLSDALLNLIYWIEEGSDLEVEPCLDPFLPKTQFNFSYVLSSVVFPNAFRQAFVDFYFTAEHWYLFLNFRKTGMSSLLNYRFSLSFRLDL